MLKTTFSSSFSSFGFFCFSVIFFDLLVSMCVLFLFETKTISSDTHTKSFHTVDFPKQDNLFFRIVWVPLFYELPWSRRKVFYKRVFYKKLLNEISKKEFYRKTPVQESLFNKVKVTGFGPAILLKKRLRHRYFICIYQIFPNNFCKTFPAGAS